KNSDEFTTRFSQAFFQRASFKSSPINPMNVLEIDFRKLGYFLLNQRRCLIGAVIQNLYFKQIGWIIQFGNCLDQSLHHIQFIEYRQLNGDSWQNLGQDMRHFFQGIFGTKKSQKQMPLSEAVDENEQHSQGIN